MTCGNHFGDHPERNRFFALKARLSGHLQRAHGIVPDGNHYGAVNQHEVDHERTDGYRYEHDVQDWYLGIDEVEPPAGDDQSYLIDGV